MPRIIDLEATRAILPSLSQAEKQTLKMVSLQIFREADKLTLEDFEALQLLQYLIDYSMDTPSGSTIPTQLVGIVGRVASGKGTVGDILQSDHQFQHHVLSDRLREAALLQGKKPPYDRSFLRQVNDIFKPLFGKHVFVAWTLQLISQLSKPAAHSVDGFRSVEEAEFFIDHGGILLGIQADPEVRFDRLKQRNRANDTFEWSDFQETERIEGDWIDPIFPLAAHTLNNNGSTVELRQQINQILQKITKEKRHE